MTQDPHDVVRVAAGEMVVIELLKQALADEGIEGRVLGEDLEASFGTALPTSVELWVNAADAHRARAVLARAEADRGKTPADQLTDDPPPATS
ncbi:MAG: DUF2007 domain-containing protein [Gemmataceae bacterium]|nr:DUF2007 domain-containing protein [Gemmataceae bacterium]